MFRYQFLVGSKAKRAYVSACATESAQWLRASAANPSEYMTPMHIALQLVAARRKERAKA
jgi:hypothetical protein